MKTLITEKGLANLREQLKEKKDFLRKLQDEKSHAYTASGDGWHDNPGWTQLGQQEEMLSAEIVKLERSLSNSILIDASKIGGSRVQIGCRVTYRMVNNLRESTHAIYIVGAGETDVKKRMISYDAPIGKALYNLETGDEVSVELPSGIVTLKIEEVVYE